MFDPLILELATDRNFDAQRYLLANPDLADPFRDGLDPRAHFERHGRAEKRRQLAAFPAVPADRRTPGVTLVAICRNERRFLIEWVAYHRLIGFERIIIYDNETNDGSESLLARMAAIGLIELRRWTDRPGRSAQRSSYEDAVVRSTTRWMFFLDLDEFLNLHVDGTIEEFIQRFPPGVSAIGINWRIFGSSGLVDAGPEPVIQRFTRASQHRHPLNRHIKTLAVAADVYKVLPHRVRLMKGDYVDASGSALDPGRGFAPVHHEVAQINHYAVKSRCEFEEKRRRGCVLRTPADPEKQTHRDGSYFEDHDRNEEADLSILRHSDALAEEMERLSGLLGPDLGN